MSEQRATGYGLRVARGWRLALAAAVLCVLLAGRAAAAGPYNLAPKSASELSLAHGTTSRTLTAEKIGAMVTTPTLSGYVAATRTVTGGGLATGGGALSSNQVITVTTTSLRAAQNNGITTASAGNLFAETAGSNTYSAGTTQTLVGVAATLAHVTTVTAEQLRMGAMGIWKSSNSANANVVANSPGSAITGVESGSSISSSRNAQIRNVVESYNCRISNSYTDTPGSLVIHNFVGGNDTNNFIHDAWAAAAQPTLIQHAQHCTVSGLNNIIAIGAAHNAAHNCTIEGGAHNRAGGFVTWTSGQYNDNFGVFTTIPDGTDNLITTGTQHGDIRHSQLSTIDGGAGDTIEGSFNCEIRGSTNTQMINCEGCLLIGVQNVTLVGQSGFGDSGGASYRADSSIPYFTSLTANTVPYLDSGQFLRSSGISPTVLGYLSDVTSAIGAQFSGKASLTAFNDFKNNQRWRGNTLTTGTQISLATRTKDITSTGTAALTKVTMPYHLELMPSATYSIGASDWLVPVDPSGGANDVTLPAVASSKGQTRVIASDMRDGGGASTVVHVQSGERLNGLLNGTFDFGTSDGASVIAVCGDDSWYLVGYFNWNLSGI